MFEDYIAELVVSLVQNQTPSTMKRKAARPTNIVYLNDATPPLVNLYRFNRSSRNRVSDAYLYSDRRSSNLGINPLETSNRRRIASSVQTDSHPASCHSYDCNGILIVRAPIDGAPEKVVTVTLRVRISYLSHYPTPAGHPREKRMLKK